MIPVVRKMRRIRSLNAAGTMRSGEERKVADRREERPEIAQAAMRLIVKRDQIPSQTGHGTVSDGCAQ